MDIINTRDAITADFGGNLLVLRTVQAGDLENLRHWKNEQREFFFHKEIITIEQQRAWFVKFQAHNYDYMFIIDLNSESIGCMGSRLLNDVWDIYNVILGLPGYAKNGFMGKAFQMMLTYAQSVRQCPITLQVLKANPAVAWYKKNGFVIVAEQADHYSMAYQSNSI